MTPPRRADVAASYDRGVDAYEALWSPVILPAATALVRHLGLRNHSRVIDVGAGTGALLDSIRSVAPSVEVVALDASVEMLRIAHHQRQTPAVLGDALDLPFADLTADVVVLAFVLFHLADPRKGLAEAARVLRPHGRVGTVTWAWERGSRAHAVVDEVFAEAAVPPLPPRRIDTDLRQPDTVDRLLRSAGLVPRSIWLQQLHRQWDSSSFWRLARGSGENRTRLALVDAETRSDVLARLRRRLDSLGLQDFYWEGEVVCAVAQRAVSTS